MGRFHRQALAALIVLGTVSAVAGQVLDAPPEDPDLTRYYLFYEHGKIVEGSDGRPSHPELGAYEYRAILDALAAKGFVVISEIRPANAEVKPSADRLARRVKALLDAGVPPNHVTLLGASKGGLITLAASRQLHRPEMRVVILAGMFRGMADDPHFRPCGAVLAIHDSADRAPLSPETFFDGNECVPEHRVVVTDLNLGHGLLYTPREEWVEELVRWSGMATPAP